MHVFASNWSDRQKEEWHQIKFLRVPNVDKDKEQAGSSA